MCVTGFYTLSNTILPGGCQVLYCVAFFSCFFSTDVVLICSVYLPFDHAVIVLMTDRANCCSTSFLGLNHTCIHTLSLLHTLTYISLSHTYTLSLLHTHRLCHTHAHTHAHTHTPPHICFLCLTHTYTHAESVMK